MSEEPVPILGNLDRPSGKVVEPEVVEERGLSPRAPLGAKGLLGGRKERTLHKDSPLRGKSRDRKPAEPVEDTRPGNVQERERMRRILYGE
jgi:hypothetical protein